MPDDVIGPVKFALVVTVAAAIAELQPNPVPVVYFNALEEVLHEGIANAVGATAVRAPRTEFAVIAVVRVPAVVAVAALPPIFKAAAVPVRFVATPEIGVPRAGPVKVGDEIVGDVSITKVVPVPVCAVMEVVFPVPVIGPVILWFVVTVAALPPMLRADAVPVKFVATPEIGVPRAGPVKVGDTLNTIFPVPVAPVVVTPSATKWPEIVGVVIVGEV